MLSVSESRAAAATVGVPEVLADLSVFRVLLQHPPLARWFADFLLGLLGRGRLDARLRELVIMRLGWATCSVYEWTQHWRIALGAGVDAGDLLAVRDWRSADRFGPAERAVLAATDETLDSGTVSAETWQECARHVSGEPQTLLELVAAIGLWRMVSGVLRTLEIPLEDGVDGWPPDGVAPGVVN
jgi:alkylhydroperoxidase family enzyme